MKLRYRSYREVGKGIGALQAFPRIEVESEARFPQCTGMIRCRIVLLMLTVAICGGCKKTVLPAAVPQEEASLPTEAQPKLETMKLWLGAEEMEAELALTGTQMQTGMMFRTNLAENAGMLFVFPGPHQASFWMKNCPLPLSAAYIDPEGVILEIHDLQPYNTNSVVASSDQVQFVLETNQGWFKRHHITTGMAVRTERGPLRETFFGQR